MTREATPFAEGTRIGRTLVGMAKNEDLAWLYGTQTPPQQTPPPATPGTGHVPAHIAPAPRPQGSVAPAQTPPPLGPRPAAPPPRPQPPFQPQPTVRRRRRPGRTILTSVLALVLAYAMFLIVTPIIAWGRMTTVDNDPDGPRPGQQPGTAILLVGSDSRQGLTDEEAIALGLDTSTEGARTDTIMLLYVPPQGSSVLISLPRDSYVDVPGYGPNKINAAYALGGPKLLTATVEQATGMRIDGYVEIGFGGFATVVDAVGGVTLCPKNAIEAESSYPRIEPGCQRMAAKTALWFVRSRHSDADQDLGRITRQREFLSAILSSVLSPATFLNPVRYWNVTMAMAKGLRLGRSTSQSDAVMMLAGMRSVAKDGLSLSVPIADPDYQTPAGSSVLWDEEQARSMFAELASGSTDGMIRFKR